MAEKKMGKRADFSNAFRQDLEWDDEKSLERMRADESRAHDIEIMKSMYAGADAVRALRDLESIGVSADDVHAVWQSVGRTDGDANLLKLNDAEFADAAEYVRRENFVKETIAEREFGNMGEDDAKISAAAKYKTYRESHSLEEIEAMLSEGGNAKVQAQASDAAPAKQDAEDAAILAAEERKQKETQGKEAAVVAAEGKSGKGEKAPSKKKHASKNATVIDAGDVADTAAAAMQGDNPASKQSKGASGRSRKGKRSKFNVMNAEDAVDPAQVKEGCNKAEQSGKWSRMQARPVTQQSFADAYSDYMNAKGNYRNIKREVMLSHISRRATMAKGPFAPLRKLAAVPLGIKDYNMAKLRTQHSKLKSALNGNMVGIDPIEAQLEPVEAAPTSKMPKHVKVADASGKGGSEKLNLEMMSCEDSIKRAKHAAAERGPIGNGGIGRIVDKEKLAACVNSIKAHAQTAWQATASGRAKVAAAGRDFWAGTAPGRQQLGAATVSLANNTMTLLARAFDKLSQGMEFSMDSTRKKAMSKEDPVVEVQRQLEAEAGMSGPSRQASPSMAY